MGVCQTYPVRQGKEIVSDYHTTAGKLFNLSNHYRLTYLICLTTAGKLFNLANHYRLTYLICLTTTD